MQSSDHSCAGANQGGDVLPGQLIVEGEPTSVRALPSINQSRAPSKYVRLTGCNPGHTIGVRMVVVLTAGMDKVTQDMVKLVLN